MCPLLYTNTKDYYNLSYNSLANKLLIKYTLTYPYPILKGNSIINDVSLLIILSACILPL